jgi:hypothetical protein
VDAAGNAIAVWYQGAAVVTNHFDVYSSQLSAATGTWSAPAMRSNGSNSAYLPKVAVNGNGQGLVLWTQDLHDGSVSNDAMAVMGMSYAPGSGWGAEACLNSASGTTRAIYAQAAVAMDAAGNGMALWVQAGSSGPFDIWAAAWAAGAWRTAAPIADNVIDCCYAPELAFVSAGVAVATWNQQNTQTAYTAANLYADGAWGTASMISDGTEDAYYPHIAVDACGNADVIWFQAGTADVTIRSNRFLAGSGWGTPQLIGVTGVTPLEFAGEYATPVSAIGCNAAGMSFTAWGIDPD